MRLRGGSEKTPTHQLSGVSFGFFTGDEVKQLSVKEITNPETFDALNNPNPSGLYDSALGPFNRSDTCTTCRQQHPFCPGHMGHIQLVLPVYHPVFFKEMMKLLKISCLICHRLVARRHILDLLAGQLKLTSAGLLADSYNLEQAYNSFLASSSGEDVHDRACSTIHTFVKKAFKQAGINCTRTFKHALSRNIVDYRRRLLGEFFKSMKVTSCPHCKAPYRTFRQEGSARIFLKPLSARSGAKMAAIMLQDANTSAVLEKFEEANGQLADSGVSDESEEDEDTDTSIASKKGKLGALFKPSVKLQMDQLITKLCSQQLLTPLEVRQHLVELWKEEGDMMVHLFGVLDLPEQHSPAPKSIVDVFFLEVLPVAPTCFRPVGYSSMYY